MTSPPPALESRITGLDEHPRRAGRVTVSIDGTPIGALSLDLVADLGVREGVLVSAAMRRDLEIAVRRTALLDKALDLLAVRARSAGELRRRLARPRPATRRPPRGSAPHGSAPHGSAPRGSTRSGKAPASPPEAVPPHDLEWVIERLTAQGYLDDAQFARQFARARIVGGGVSRRRLQDELYRRGVGREIAAEAIDHTLDDAQLDEYQAARAAARKRVRSLGALEPQVLRRRLYGFLARRGYEPDVVHRVMREVLAGGEEPEETGESTD